MRRSRGSSSIGYSRSRSHEELQISGSDFRLLVRSALALRRRRATAQESAPTQARAEDLRSDPRSVRARRRRVLPRVEAATARSSTATSTRSPPIDATSSARRAARVLAERLQRARPADGHRSLSDPATVGATTRRAASGRSPARSSACRTASRGRTRDARPDRADDPRRRSTIRACTSRSAAARSAAAGCAARRSTAARSKGSSPKRPTSASRRAQCVQHRSRGEQVSVSSIFSWREKEFSAAYADKAPPAVREPQPDRARHARVRRSRSC